MCTLDGRPSSPGLGLGFPCLDALAGGCLATDENRLPLGNCQLCHLRTYEAQTTAPASLPVSMRLLFWCNYFKLLKRSTLQYDAQCLLAPRLPLDSRLQCRHPAILRSPTEQQVLVASATCAATSPWQYQCSPEPATRDRCEIHWSSPIE